MIYRLIVDDKPGVLDRIAGLVRRIGKNISFLLVFEAKETGKSILIFKLAGGSVDGQLTRRISELDCVSSMDTTEDTITGHIISVAGGEE
jgi:acetolactate synthase small subunit